jgi:hypothetical protein
MFNPELGFDQSQAAKFRVGTLTAEDLAKFSPGKATELPQPEMYMKVHLRKTKLFAFILTDPEEYSEVRRIKAIAKKEGIDIGNIEEVSNGNYMFFTSNMNTAYVVSAILQKRGCYHDVVSEKIIENEVNQNLRIAGQTRKERAESVLAESAHTLTSIEKGGGKPLSGDQPKVIQGTDFMRMFMGGGQGDDQVIE